VTPRRGRRSGAPGRGQPEGGLAGGLGNDLLWSRARAARPAPSRAQPRWRRPAQAAPPLMLGQPQRRIGAGPRALAQATDHLDRRGIFGIEGREREHPQTRVAGGSGEARHFGETRLDRARPARLPSRPRPTPCPASRSARAAFPHPSLASSTHRSPLPRWTPACRLPSPLVQNHEELRTRFRVLARRLVGQDEACCRSPTAV
jgi:hypothetical protein